MCPTVFYAGNSEELAFFVEDARKPGSLGCDHRIAMPHAILCRFILNLDTGKTRQQVVQRQYPVGQTLTCGHGVVDMEVARTHPL